METVRGILAAHPGGISRAGILAWAQLRIDPDFDAARLDAELAALGGEIVERDGFLWLASSAGAPVEAPSWSAPEDAPPWSPAADSSVTGTWTERGSTPAPPPPSSWAGGTRDGEGVEPAAAGGEAGQPTYADYETAPDTGAIPEPGAGPIPGWSKPSGVVGSWATKIIALAIAVGFLISNLVGFLGDDEESDATPFPTGPRASMTGSLGPYEAMAVGDCIAIPEAQEFSEVLFVSCTAEHDAEVFHVGSSPGSDDDYPSDDEFEAYVDDACLPAFHGYTGSDYYDQSELQMGWFVPAEETWASGDHTVHCYLTPADGSTTNVSWRGANP